jgi:Domain of unknown function (DUF4303)
MTSSLENLRIQLTGAVLQAEAELRSRNSELFGFALCTDDDVSGVYHVACTQDWVLEKQAVYPDIGFIYTDWTLKADDAPFDIISRKFAELGDEDCANDKDWSAARDERFNLLVLALGDCRVPGAFAPDTFLCAGSTDPSGHLEALAMKGVEALNTPLRASEFARALGYEKYRIKA